VPVRYINMAITRKNKEEIVAELEATLESNKAVVLLSTDGAEETLSAIQNTEFRSKAMEGSVKLKVIKNNLVRKALEKFELPEFMGSTYVAYLTNPENGDEIIVPKVTVNLTKEKDYKKSIKVLGAVVNGEFYDTAKVIELSNVSSFPDSMSMIAGMLEQITAKVARGVKEIPTTVARGVSEAGKTLS